MRPQKCQTTVKSGAITGNCTGIEQRDTEGSTIETPKN